MARDDGYSIKQSYKENIKLYLGFLIAGVLFSYYGLANKNVIITLLGGIFVAYPIRNYSWMKSIKENWSFSVEITDWAKAEEIAKENETNNDSN